jgi:hypothetical protein
VASSRRFGRCRSSVCVDVSIYLRKRRRNIQLSVFLSRVQSDIHHIDVQRLPIRKTDYHRSLASVTLFLEHKGLRVLALCVQLRGVATDLEIPLFVISNSAGRDNALQDALRGLTDQSIICRRWIETSAAQGELNMLELKDIGIMSRGLLLERCERAAWLWATLNRVAARLRTSRSESPM